MIKEIHSHLKDRQSCLIEINDTFKSISHGRYTVRVVHRYELFYDYGYQKCAGPPRQAGLGSLLHQCTGNSLGSLQIYFDEGAYSYGEVQVQLYLAGSLY